MEYRIQLTRGQSTLVDPEDYAKLAGFRWQARLNSHTGTFYARRRLAPSGKTVYMAREILGITDPRVRVDHVNHDTLDNRKSNLRIATEAQNQHNQKRHRDSSTGFKGVTFDPRLATYRARIMANGKRKSLGAYPTPEMAYQARLDAEKKFHGEFSFNG